MTAALINYILILHKFHYCLEKGRLLVGINRGSSESGCSKECGKTRVIYHLWNPSVGNYSTVTDLARLRGWSTSVPLCAATW